MGCRCRRRFGAVENLAAATEARTSLFGLHRTAPQSPQQLPLRWARCFELITSRVQIDPEGIGQYSFWRPLLEDFAAYGLIESKGRRQGKTDLWVKCLWDREE
jgi:hypothetical protein